MKTFRIILTACLLSAALHPLLADNRIINFINNGTSKTKDADQRENIVGSDNKQGLGNVRIAASPFLEKALKRKGDTSAATERYYANVIRQYGWLIGLGKPMSKAQAEKLGRYYRLSDKNSKGRWQRVEYINNDSSAHKSLQLELLSSLIETPMQEESLNHNIIEKAVSWEFIADPTGTLMLEERGFDAEGNLLYIMNSTEYAEGKFVLSFLYSNTLPMFTDRTLHIQCDPQGRFHIVNFTDDLGYYFPNTEGVYEIHVEYSSDSYKYINCNIAGNPL